MITGFLLILSLHNPGMPKNVDVLYNEGIYVSVQTCVDAGRHIAQVGFFGDNVVGFECKLVELDVE